jgi:competence protein ComEC
VAAAVVVGIWLSEALDWSAAFSIAGTASLLVLSLWLRQKNCPVAENFVLTLALVGLGASLWAVRSSIPDGQDISVLATDGRIIPQTPVRLTGRIANIPSLDSVADSTPLNSAVQRPPKTLFLLNAESLIQTELIVPMRGKCRVLVEGDATDRLNWGDRVELIGRIDLPSPPQNPGEFDYAQYLRRSGISAMMFVKHPEAIRVVQGCWWHPRSLLTGFRQETVALLRVHLSPQNRATAEALLLGNRGHLTPELERDFIASGSMHLLAISGLHVGILYVFLIRVLNLLVVPRTRALIVAGTVCVVYCFLTDLRPSVVRATVFIVLHILGQILCRDIRMGSLIGATAMLLLVVNPSIAFNVGAWLSFLAVGALGWIAERSSPPADRPTPADFPSWQDRLRDLGSMACDRLSLRYRQMAAVMLLSAPLVMSQFHVVSLTGMVINVVLIPFTAMTLVAGYLFVVIGLTVPIVAVLPAMIFQSLLSVMNWVVVSIANIRIGYLTIPDLPAWFLPTYFVLLSASAIASQQILRQGIRLVLLVFVAVHLWIACQPPDAEGLVCTVLSVGHGNAVIVETPDRRVLVFDAGAMNRGERTATAICQFLWHKGHRMIDAVVVSHPDMDHYNAVASLMDRLPVGEVMITSEFARSSAGEVQHVLQKMSVLEVPCTIVMNGDRVSLEDVIIDFCQADVSHKGKSSDNEASLVAVLQYRNRCICIPGDLEGEGQYQLIPEMQQCDLLISPHHGSLNSNSQELAEKLRPAVVVVSSSSDRSRPQLRELFAPAPVMFTATDGAVTFQISPVGSTSVDSFLAD